MLPFPAMMGAAGPACVWNNATLEGNGAAGPPNVFGCNSGGPGSMLGSVGFLSGKRYFEVSCRTPSNVSGCVPHVQVGISQMPSLTFGASGRGCRLADGGDIEDADTFGSIGGYMPSFTAAFSTAFTTVIIQVAVDLTANLIWFGRDGTMVGNPAAGTGGRPILNTTYFPAIAFPYTGTFPGGQFNGTAGFNSSSFVYGITGFAQWR